MPSAHLPITGDRPEGGDDRAAEPLLRSYGDATDACRLSRQAARTTTSRGT
ncbi:hypothetical protein GCM10010377_01650 [Streptomyces viridiviolaceus]|uniref:Uncharacterized protein n=1 Tax=Streptomyces viridiviolaceus TaxID=68282 RepID=A0ABW2E207_9ACTN|nr:hypothetical protein [Streptomyces viridiviolaceus]GHB15883.1 hypothetical protein GCM10010377_01650 [Streptomyces viridiviolaceus]